MRGRAYSLALEPPYNPLVYRGLMLVLNSLFHSYWRVEVTGKEHFPSPGRPVLVALLHHTSALDIFAMGVAVQRPMYFLTKRETFSLPVLGPIFARVGGIAANRDKQDLPAIKQMLAGLQGNHWLAVAPEGTRSKDGKLLPFDPGFLWVAQKSRALILPAVLWGVDQRMSKGSRLPRPGRIQVHFHAPSDPFGAGAPDEKASRARLAEMAAEWRAWTQAQLDVLASGDHSLDA